VSREPPTVFRIEWVTKCKPCGYEHTYVEDAGLEEKRVPIRAPYHCDDCGYPLRRNAESYHQNYEIKEVRQ